MPADQEGQIYDLKSGKKGIRWYDEHGIRRRQSPFESKSEARRWFRASS